MPRDPNKYLEDMLVAARKVDKYTRGKSLRDFLVDENNREAVYFNFFIVGEAMSSLRRVDEALVERFTEWDRIIGFRNQVIHGYYALEHETTWRIITSKLPILIAELEAIIPPTP